MYAFSAFGAFFRSLIHALLAGLNRFSSASRPVTLVASPARAPSDSAAVLRSRANRSCGEADDGAHGCDNVQARCRRSQPRPRSSTVALRADLAATSVSKDIGLAAATAGAPKSIPSNATSSRPICIRPRALRCNLSESADRPLDNTGSSLRTRLSGCWDTRRAAMKRGHRSRRHGSGRWRAFRAYSSPWYMDAASASANTSGISTLRRVQRFGTHASLGSPNLGSPEDLGAVLSRPQNRVVHATSYHCGRVGFQLLSDANPRCVLGAMSAFACAERARSSSLCLARI
ncbi:hypothetical protein B0H10DRAFT_2223134 [Mycena sp. CBHHK59/15]|nr:hypothetical protein B0H10DRAFT_2223134 [Mycena sp. CBHHK59/15]